jgi:hypothetical protein
MHFKPPETISWVGLTDLYPALVRALEPSEHEPHKRWLNAFRGVGLCQETRRRPARTALAHFERTADEDVRQSRRRRGSC